MKKILLVALVSTFALQIKGMAPDVDKLFICAADEQWKEVPAGTQLSVGTKFVTMQGWSLTAEKKQLICNTLTTMAQAMYEHVVFTRIVEKQVRQIAKTQESATQKDQKIKHRLELLKTSLKYVQELCIECARSPFMDLLERKEFQEVLDTLKDAARSLEAYSSKGSS